MAQASTLQQTIEKIHLLLNENNLQDAIRACNELLRYDPENKELIHLKNKIEKLIQKNNQNLIEKELKKLDPLWTEKKYKEILESLEKLLPFAPDFPKIHQIYQKAQKEYLKFFTEEQRKIFEAVKIEIHELVQNQKYSEALLKLRKLQYPQKEIAILKQEIEDQWIFNEIKNNQTLLESSKFLEIQKFLEQLKKINPESQEIQRLFTENQKKKRESERESNKNFIENGFREAEKFYAEKNYQKTLSILKEILEVDVFNKKAKNFLKKTQQKLEKQTKNEVIDQMLAAQMKMKFDFKKDPKAYLRI